MNENTKKIIGLFDGIRSSKEIAGVVGLSPRYVRKVAKKYDLDRLPQGAQKGHKNHQFVSGRRIDLDGYVLVTAPDNHPHGRPRPDRRGKIILEHRLIAEQTIGRYLDLGEVVDHIDGLTLHNHPANLRVFESNAAHLRATLTGRCPHWSVDGKKHIGSPLPSASQPVDKYADRRERGEIRLQQILLALLQLGIDSPYLLGMHHHLEIAGIDYSSHTTIKRALVDQYQKWGVGHAL